MPPTKIELSGILSGTRLEVKENEEVELTCVVHDAKPKATIVWYKQNTEFYTGTFVCQQSSFAIAATGRRTRERANERGNERASITDSAGVPNDLPSFLPLPPSSPRRNPRAREASAAAASIDKK